MQKERSPLGNVQKTGKEDHKYEFKELLHNYDNKELKSQNPYQVKEGQCLLLLTRTEVERKERDHDEDWGLGVVSVRLKEKIEGLYQRSIKNQLSCT